jgi:hypothetical protein
VISVDAQPAGDFIARLCVPEVSAQFYESPEPAPSKEEAKHDAALAFLIDNGLWPSAPIV